MIRLNDSGDLVRWGQYESLPPNIEVIVTAAELRTALAEAGLAIVPVEPSEAMLRAGYPPNGPEAQGWGIAEIYEAMLQAALKEAE